MAAEKRGRMRGLALLMEGRGGRRKKGRKGGGRNIDRILRERWNLEGIGGSRTKGKITKGRTFKR